MPDSTIPACPEAGAGSVHLGLYVDAVPDENAGFVHLERLKEIAAPVARTRKVPASVIREALIQLCREDYLSIRDIAALLNRTPETMRVHYLNKLIREKVLELRYPDKPGHPDQGYRTRP